MKQPSVFGTTLLMGCMLASSMAATGSCSAGETLRANYAVSFAGLPVGVADLAGTVDNKSYRLDLTAKLTGLAGMIMSFRGAGSASGRMAGARLVPSAFSTATANPDGNRTIRMGMTNGGVTAVSIVPPIDARPDRIPLRAGDKRNIIDPMSALLMPVAGTSPLLGPAGCDRTIPIFDGFTRFNINLTFVREENVQTRGYNGPVVVCAARYQPISGHRNRRAVRDMAANRDLTVWLAPLGTSRIVVPYKILIKTPVGDTDIEASEFVVNEAASAQPRSE